MRIIIEDESCDLLNNASLLLERIKEDYLATHGDNNLSRETTKSMLKRASSSINYESKVTGKIVSSSSGSTYIASNENSGLRLRTGSQSKRKAALEAARAICDEVIRDSIGSCREADYKMELAKLLSAEAKIELYIEHGKLSDAQRLACSMNRPDYVARIIEEAVRLNQNHVKTVCQLWLAKHETRNSGS